MFYGRLQVFAVCCNIPGTTYYLYSHLFRRPPQQPILTENFRSDANKGNGWVSQRRIYLVHSVSTTFSKKLYPWIWPMSRNKKDNMSVVFVVVQPRNYFHIVLMLVRSCINMVCLSVFTSNWWSCTFRPPRLLCCFPLHRWQISSDITSAPLSSTATKRKRRKD